MNSQTTPYFTKIIHFLIVTKGLVNNYDEFKTLRRILFDVSLTIFTKPSFEHCKQSNITVSVRYSGACSVPGVVNRMKSVGLLFDWFGSQT